MNNVGVDDINDLAQFISQIIGDNKMSTARLAEEILEWQADSAQPAGTIPEGWKLVPVEPTEEMLIATSWPKCAKRDYEHMLLNAPQPPREQGGE